MLFPKKAESAKENELKEKFDIESENETFVSHVSRIKRIWDIGCLNTKINNLYGEFLKS